MERKVRHTEEIGGHLIMKPTTEFFEMCQIVFSYCMKFWNISAHQMGELIRRYKLASYVMEADDLFQFYGPGSIAELVEEHINRLGGVVQHGV